MTAAVTATGTAEIDPQSQWIGRAQALREIGQVLNRCIEDDSGVDGVLRWLVTAAQELDHEIDLRRGTGAWSDWPPDLCGPTSPR